MAITLIRHCSVIDVRNQTVIPKTTLRLEEGWISVLRHDEASEVSPDADVLDGTGLFALPGLIDMHVHSGTHRGADAAGVAGLAQAARNLETAALAGITTVRDVGTPYVAFDLKALWERGDTIVARPIVAGPLITSVAGHGSISDGARAGLGVEVAGVGDTRRVVRDLIARGAQLIKLVADGPTAKTQLTSDELRAAADEAHSQGIPVACHTCELDSLRRGIDAGVDSIEHGCGADRKALEAMAERGIALCPTLTLMARVDTSPALGGGEGSPFVAWVKRMWESHQWNIPLAHEIGVTLIAGTDAGAGGIEFDSLAEELAWLVKCGISPGTALASATINAAEWLGREDIGEIATGKIADLLFVGANPLANIEALADRRAIFQSGSMIWSQHALFAAADRSAN